MNILYWLLCVLIGLIPALLLYRSDRRRDMPVRWLPSLLRFFTCMLTAALLLAPAFPSVRTEEEKPLLIWLQDNSSSMRRSLGADTAAYRQRSKQLLDKWQDRYTVVPLSFGAALGHDSTWSFNQRSTDIAAALQAATAQYQDQNIGAVILASDGIYNEGLDPLYAPLGSAVPVYTVGLGDSTQPVDIAVTRVYANKTAALHSEFEVIADVRADKLAGVGTSLGISLNGRALAQAPVRVDNNRFTTTVRFMVKAEAKGFQRYSVALPQLNGEQNTGNNRMDFFVEVLDESVRVLIVAAAPHPDVAAIRDALESVPQYKVDVVNSPVVPATGQYNLVIAHQSLLPQHAASKIPVWYILGRQSNLQAFSQQQDLVKIAGGGNPNDVLPELNTGFNYFNLPAGIKEVLVRLPPLQAPYGSYTAAGDAQVLLRQRIGAVTTGYPLWLLRNNPAPMAVLCGEGLWRWRMYEYKNSGKHEVVDEMIRQTVNLLNTRKDARPFRVFMDKYILADNESVNIYAELKNDNGELVNTPDASLTLSDSSGKDLRYALEKNGNSYRLNIGLLAPGNYRFTGKTSYNGQAYTSEGSFVVTSVPLEQLRSHADFGLMARLAQQSGGAFFTYATMQHLSDSLERNKSVRPVIHADKTYTELIDRRWLFFIILLLAAGEWLLRKYWNT